MPNLANTISIISIARIKTYLEYIFRCLYIVEVIEFSPEPYSEDCDDVVILPRHCWTCGQEDVLVKGVCKLGGRETRDVREAMDSGHSNSLIDYMRSTFMVKHNAFLAVRVWYFVQSEYPQSSFRCLFGIWPSLLLLHTTKGCFWTSLCFSFTNIGDVPCFTLLNKSFLFFIVVVRKKNSFRFGLSFSKPIWKKHWGDIVYIARKCLRSSEGFQNS